MEVKHVVLLSVVWIVTVNCGQEQMLIRTPWGPGLLQCCRSRIPVAEGQLARLHNALAQKTAQHPYCEQYKWKKRNLDVSSNYHTSSLALVG